MDQEKIEIIQAQLVHGFIKGTQGQVIAVVCIPQLGRDKEILPGHAAQADGFSHAFLVAVGLGGIDMCISGVDGAPDGLNGGFTVGCLPRSKTEAGNRYAV